MSQPSYKAGLRGKSSRAEQLSQQSSSEPPEPLELLPYIRASLEAGKEMSAKAREEVERIRSELRPWLGEEEELIGETEVVDLEAAHATLFSDVKSAVQAADSQIDKLCFKRRPSPPADAKKGVTSTLEQLAEEVWRAVAEGTEKPLTQQLVRLFPVLNTLCSTVDALHHTLEDTINRVEAGQPAAEEIKPTAPQDIPKQEERKDQVHPRLLKPPDQAVTEEIQAVLGDMQTLMVGKGRSEDSEVGRIRREVGKIKVRLETLWKTMEEQEMQSVGQRSVPIAGRNAAVDDFDLQTEHSQASARPASNLTIDTEDIKSELSRQQSTVISVLNEHKQGIQSVAVAQATLQSKQDTLTMEVAEIRKKLNEVFPSSYNTGRKQDFTRPIAILKSLFPNIRSINDTDFFEKFTKQLLDERTELDTFLAAIRSEGCSFVSLEELASEFSKLKASIGSLQEEREDALLKMIRVQSEYEIEMEFLKAKVVKLENELSQLRDSVLSSEEVAFLQAKIDELTLENARLRGDAFDLSSVEPPRDSIDDYSKNDELAFLKLQLHQKKERLGRLRDSRKDSGLASPSEMFSTSDRYEREAAEIKRLTRQIQTIEGSQDVADSVATREMDMKPVDKKLASHIMTLLNLTGAFEICGTVSFGEDMWALVKVGRGFVWVKSELDRYKMSSEEMIVQCAQATKMLEAHSNLPRNLVLALGQLMGQTEAK